MSSAGSAPLLHETAAPIGGRFWNRFTAVLTGFVVAMVVVLLIRFFFGIGAVTHLSDGYPWGIWIAYDVVVGSALAAGGFSVALLVYILNRGEYHPIIRPALVAAILGYMQAGASVIFDLGRYWDFWHIFWPKYVQVNSVLFEVALCITAYILVLWIEFTPVILERFGLEQPRKKLNRLLFVFVGLGVLLPVMHQSSLGSMLVILGPQIHPLYQTNLLPLLFLLACIGMGFAAVVFEGTVSALGLRRRLELAVFAKLTQIARLLVGIFVFARILDVLARGATRHMVELSWPAAMFWVENILFLVPQWLMWSRDNRRNPTRVFTAACFMALGGILYRISAYLIAYETGPGWHYFPSLGELVVTLGLVAFEVLGIILAIRFLPILPKETPKAPARAGA